MASNEPWRDSASDDSDKRLEKAQELLGKVEKAAKSLAEARYVTAMCKTDKGLVTACIDGTVWRLHESQFGPLEWLQLPPIPQL